MTKMCLWQTRSQYHHSGCSWNCGQSSQIGCQGCYPEDIIFNNKLVTLAKAKIAFGKELTKAGVKQDLKADQFQFVLKDRFGKVLETVGNTADGQVAFSELTFNKVGTYNYTVEELAGKDDAIVYDTMKLQFLSR